ncbi:MAG: 6,7-dimethyl-8-ribityllumazine synthase [Nanoarchaeota archaeon]
MARIGIVVSMFNEDITRAMLERAKALIKVRGELGPVREVPGAYDIPLAVKQIIGEVDGVITLGAIIKGETKHDEVIAFALAQSLTQLSLDTGKPITLGVSGPGMSRKHAEDRKGAYATRAVEAVFQMLL